MLKNAAIFLKTHRFILGFVVGFVGVFAGLTIANAQSVAPVTMDINQAEAFTNVAQEGDLLVLIRYELPIDEWQFNTTTAPFMTDAVCDDEDDFADRCYTSLESGIALQTMYDDDPTTTGTLIGSRTLPRIGRGLSALYFEPGHGIADNDIDVRTCVEGSATVFSPVPQSCLTLQWNVTADRAATRAEAPLTLIQMGINLADGAGFPFEMLDQNLISDEGIVFYLEAFGIFLSTVPGAFVVGVDILFTDFDASVTPTALETSIQSSAQSSQAYQTVDRAAQQYLGLSVRTLGSTVVLTVAAAFIALAFYWTKSIEIAAMFGLPFVGFGMFMDWIPLAVGFSLLAGLLVVGAIWAFRRIPR